MITVPTRTFSFHRCFSRRAHMMRYTIVHFELWILYCLASLTSCEPLHTDNLDRGMSAASHSDSEHDAAEFDFPDMRENVVQVDRSFAYNAAEETTARRGNFSLLPPLHAASAIHNPAVLPVHNAAEETTVRCETASFIPPFNAGTMVHFDHSDDALFTENADVLTAGTRCITRSQRRVDMTHNPVVFSVHNAAEETTVRPENFSVLPPLHA